MKANWWFMFVLLLGGACTSSPENATTGEDTSWYVPDSTYTTSTIVNTDTVRISQMKFVPEQITVQKGDTVIWINDDLVAHCVTEEHSKSWTSSKIAAGTSWKMVVTESADYYCAIHQVMKGKLVLESTRTATQ